MYIYKYTYKILYVCKKEFLDEIQYLKTLLDLLIQYYLKRADHVVAELQWIFECFAVSIIFAC